jgi:hypothetical protein
MCTNAQHDEPFWSLHPVRIGLGITQLSYVDGFRVFDFVCGAVADEHRLASPFDNYLERAMSCQWSGLVIGVREGDIRTFLPSGIADRSISTLAWASTSAEADMLTKKSIVEL